MLIKYYVIKHFILLKVQNMMDINVDFPQCSIHFLHKKTSVGAPALVNKSAITNQIISNKELAWKLHKPIIRKFNKWKVHSSFIDNIWGANLVDMQLISNFNKGFRFLLCVIDTYSKYSMGYCFSKNFR